jgi:hypothetical protein
MAKFPNRLGMNILKADGKIILGLLDIFGYMVVVQLVMKQDNRA